MPDQNPLNGNADSLIKCLNHITGDALPGYYWEPHVEKSDWWMQLMQPDCRPAVLPIYEWEKMARAFFPFGISFTALDGPVDALPKGKPANSFTSLPAPEGFTVPAITQPNIALFLTNEPKMRAAMDAVFCVSPAITPVSLEPERLQA